MTEEQKRLWRNYTDALVGRVYKILPMAEGNSPTILLYLTSLYRELLGNHALIEQTDYDCKYTELLGLLHWMIDSGARAKEIRSEVFHAIAICKDIRHCLDAEEADGNG